MGALQQPPEHGGARLASDVIRFATRCWVPAEATWDRHALNGDCHSWLSVRPLCRGTSAAALKRLGEVCCACGCSDTIVWEQPVLVWEQLSVRLFCI